jgi:glycosyltransferase involved in cell wall biosynthesis
MNIGSLSDLIKLSIITINLNNKTGLERTIKSVISQTYAEFEYIIIDGGSTDGSIDIIKEHENRISAWITEKDNGIYCAMNKGIRRAHGEYCLFLNSGDVFIGPSLLNEMLAYVNGEDILYGNGFNEAKPNNVEKLECPAKLTLGFFTMYSLLHPATLIKKSLFDQYGLYNESNLGVSDWEFFIKTIILNNVRTKLIPLEIAFAEDDGVSRNNKYKTILENERAKVLNNSFPEYVIDFVNEYKDLKNKNTELIYKNNQMCSELNGYKSNVLFRAILKMMRILN